MKNKKATINFINEKENKCFQYAATVALNYEKNGKKIAENNKNQSFYR